MKWNAYANDDDLAFELTPNFNNNAGGFLVDPNDPSGQVRGRDRQRRLPQQRLLRPAQRRRLAPLRLRPRHDRPGRAADHALRRRPSGAFTRRQRHRRRQLRQLHPQLHVAHASSLFGAGVLDEVALYDRALTAGTIAAHFDAQDQNSHPQRLLHRRAQPGARPGRASPSTPPPPPIPTGRSPSTSGTSTATAPIETDTGTTATTSRTYASAGNLTVGLRVTDNGGATATTTTDAHRRASGCGTYAARGAQPPPASPTTGAWARRAGRRSPTASAAATRPRRAA